MNDTNNPFDNIEKKFKTIEINGKEYPVRLKTRDAGKVLLLMKTELTEEDADRISDIMLRMLRRGNPTVDEDVLDDFVADNYDAVFFELLVLVGFPRESLKRKVKELSNKDVDTKPKKKENVA